MQVLSISTYDYLRNTSLHYIYELELVPIPLGYGYHMMNIIQQITDPMPTNLSYIVLAKLLLLLLLLLLLQYHCYHCYCYRYYCCYHQNYHTIVLLITLLQIINLQVWLKTQLLIPSNILWLPLCRIYKFGLNTYPRKLLRSPILVGYQRPNVCLAISIAGRYQSNPGVEHWTTVKNILKHLEKTKDMFLVWG